MTANDKQLVVTTRGPGRAQRGFTLIGLMIVVAIVAILAAVAYASYVPYVVKTHRAAAQACMAEYANYMERYYTTNLRYDQTAAATPVTNTLPTLDCSTRTSQNYAYTLSNLGATTFTITATPQGAQASRDTECAALTVDQSGTRTEDGSSTLAQCWR